MLGFHRHLPVAMWAAGLVFSFSALAFARTQLESLPTRDPVTEPVYLPQAKYLHGLSLGYDNVLANLLWFRTISYFGKHYQSDRTYPWLAHMCDVVTDLDPRAEHVYRFAGMILPWEANQVSAGIRLLQKGLQTFPDSWLLHYWLGFNYYFFEGNDEAAARHMRVASTLPGAHPNTARLAAVLSTHQFGAETTLRLLAEMENEVDSPEMRNVVREHMREARMVADADQIDKAIDQFRERFGRTPSRLSELLDARLIEEIPEDPFGGHYRIDPDTGRVVSSTGRGPSELHQSRLRKKALRGDSVRDF